MRLAPLAVLLGLVLIHHEPACAQVDSPVRRFGAYYSLEIGASVFNANTGFIRAQAANVSFGARVNAWTFGAQTGPNVWRVPLFGTEEQEHVGVWNLGPFIEKRYAKGRARSQLGAGVSIVIEPSAVDAGPGSLGFYLDTRPIGLRFPTGKGWAFGVDPLGWALRVADTQGVPLAEVQFMTFLRLELNR